MTSTKRELKPVKTVLNHVIDWFPTILELAQSKDSDSIKKEFCCFNMKVFCKASVILVTEPLFNINIIVSDFLNVIKISHQHFKSVSVWRSPLVTRQHISPPSSVTNNDIIILVTLFILTHTLRIISRDSLSLRKLALSISLSE